MAGKLLFFRFKAVIVGQFFALADRMFGENDDSRRSVDLLDLDLAVGLAGVIDEARVVALLSGIDHKVVGNAEHVTADSTAIVAFFALVSKAMGDNLSDVFNQEFSITDVLHDEQSTALNF